MSWISLEKDRKMVVVKGFNSGYNPCNEKAIIGINEFNDMEKQVILKLKDQTVLDIIQILSDAICKPETKDIRILLNWALQCPLGTFRIT